MSRALVGVGAGATLLTSGYRNYIRPYLEGVKAAKKTKELFDAVRKKPKRKYDSSSDSDREVEATPLQPAFQSRAVVNTTVNESPEVNQGVDTKYKRRKMPTSTENVLSVLIDVVSAIDHIEEALKRIPTRRIQLDFF